uniref:Peptidase S1 domain-containing protein n=1 Tax=Caenorhabditis japonica TaxID=281687 RepID=A0A8R1HT88_CAEJA
MWQIAAELTYSTLANTTDISLDKSSAEGAGVLRHETIMCAGSMKSAGVPQFFVAADPYHKTVACSGDSGGGAVAKINQRTTVVGVLSQTTCDMQGRRIGPESGEIYASVAYYSTLVCQMTGVCGSGEYDKYHEGYGRKSQLATRPPVPGRPATQDSNGNIVNGDSNDSSDFFGWELVDGAMQAKVYNGREVERLEAPWTVLLKMENVNITGNLRTVSSTMCSGTVISPRHILTSTHCFALFDEKIGWSGLKDGVLEWDKCEKDHYHITDPYILGNTYIMGDDAEQLDKYPEKVTLVNGCQLKNMRKDIAMLQIDDFAIVHLFTELSFSDRVQQACVSTNTTDITLDKPSPRSTGVLRHETIMCAKSMKSAGIPHFFIAADPNHTTIACSGDSGGGAVAKINQRTTVVGVLSQTTCDIQGKRIGPESAEVYASVAYYSTLVCQMTGVCGSGEYDKYHQGYVRKSWVILIFSIQYSQPATRPPVPPGPATRDSNGNIVIPDKPKIQNDDSKESSDLFGWALVNGAMQGFSALVFQFMICILIVLG